MKKPIFLLLAAILFIGTAAKSQNTSSADSWAYAFTLDKVDKVMWITGVVNLKLFNCDGGMNPLECFKSKYEHQANKKYYDDWTGDTYVIWTTQSKDIGSTNYDPNATGIFSDYNTAQQYRNKNIQICTATGFTIRRIGVSPLDLDSNGNPQ
jgi:hypothetical protein